LAASITPNFRKLFVAAVKKHCFEKDKNYANVNTAIYQRFDARHNQNICGLPVGKRLDAVEAKGLMEKLYQVALEVLK